MDRQKDIEALRSALTAAGWNEMSVGESSRTTCPDAAFGCDYALVGVQVSENVNRVLSSWAESQVALSSLRESKKGEWRDCYLLFIVDDIEDSAWDRLRDLINDTHDCQKICLERRGRSLEEVLRDAPFLNLSSLNKAEDVELPEAVSNLRKSGLPAKLIQDLSRKGAETILEKLLNGDYSKEGAKRADQKTYS